MNEVTIRFADTEEGTPRDQLEGLVQLGLCTKEEADKIAMDIDLIMLLVERGAMTDELANAVIWDMAQEIARSKEPEWREEGPPSWAVFDHTN